MPQDLDGLVEETLAVLTRLGPVVLFLGLVVLEELAMVVAGPIDMVEPAFCARSPSPDAERGWRGLARRSCGTIPKAL